MPSKRFYRLSEEKQHLIWKASMKEFASVPYEKVSINKIIREAGISRGSFYTYFEDKKDLLSFLLEDTRRKWTDSCLECLQMADGDIRLAMKHLMDSGIRFCKNNNLLRLHKNLIMYPEMLMTECMKKGMDFKQTVQEEFYEKVDRRNLRDKSVEGVELLLKLCTIAMMKGFVEYYTNPEKEEQLKEEYQKTLEVLCYGAYEAPQHDQVEEKGNE